MLPGLTLPASLLDMLSALRPCFTAPGFVTFCGLISGLAGRVHRRTVVGMLLGGCLQHVWPHDRAHYFFARARWEIAELGLAVAQLVVLLMLLPGADLRAGGQAHEDGHQGRAGGRARRSPGLREERPGRA